jgi:predicted membrane protein
LSNFNVNYIGLPIALIILALWAILLFLSKIIASLALSDYLFKLFNKEKINNNLKISAGIFLFCILVSIPYIGWFFSLLALLAGLGSIYFYIKNKNYVN